MVKEKRILSYFFGWLVIGFLVCFIGITNVNAEETPVPVGYISNNTNLIISNNKGSDISLNLGVLNTNPIDIKNIIIGINNYSFKANVIYRIEISTPTQYLINVNSFEILAGDNACSYRSFKFANTGYPSIEFSCSYDTNYLTISLSNSASNNITNSYNFRWDYTYLYTITDVINFNPVIDNNNQNTQDIIDNNTSNTDSIIDNNNQNTQDIIDSNKETQDVIKDQFNSCRDSYNLFNISNLQSGYDTNFSLIDNGFNAIGSLYVLYPFNVSSGTYTLKYDYKVNSGNISSNTGKFRLRYIDGSYSIFYNSGSSFTINQELKEIMFYTDNGTESINIDFTNIMLQKGSVATNYEPYGEEICNNKLDDTNDKLDGIQGALTDSSAPNTSDLQNSAGWLPAGPLDSILNLPLTMLNSLTNSLGKTCSPLNLTLPYVNKNIQIPCLSSIFAQITGVNGLWTWVGTIASVLILYNYLLNLYAWVDRVLTLRAEFDEAMGADLANWGRL